MRRKRFWIVALVLALVLALLPVRHIAWAATYTVTNTQDSGAGSLRQAITDANNHSGPDTIEFDELQSGLRREGIFSGAWTGGQKLAFALGPGAVGLALSLSGYSAGDVQPEEVARGIRVMFCLVTAALVLLSLVPLSRYPLTAEVFDDIKRRIRA